MRWDRANHQDVERPDIDAFIEDLLAVCRQHGFSVSHEDQHGAFIVESFDEELARWVQQAHIGESLSA